MRWNCIHSGVVALSGLLFASVSFALPVTYDFAGSGNYCQDGGACTARDYWGTIQLLDTSHAIPPTDDFPGFVDADFDIQWLGGSFNPTEKPDTQFSAPFSTIMNGPDFDLVDFEELWGTFEPAYTEFAHITLKTPDLGWLTAMAFPDVLQLAPGSGAINLIKFGAELRLDEGNSSPKTVGFHGDMNLTKLESHSVPEPGTLMLFALGLISVPVLRRPRATISIRTRQTRGER